MNKYKVLGEEGASVDVLGEQQAVGAVIELDAEQAAPLVESGVLEAVAADEAGE